MRPGRAWFLPRVHLARSSGWPPQACGCVAGDQPGFQGEINWVLRVHVPGTMCARPPAVSRLTGEAVVGPLPARHTRACSCVPGEHV